MAVPIKPTLTRAFGNESWGFVLAIASITAPTVAELTAAGGFTLSCSVFNDQEGITANTDKVNLPQLLCETEQYEVNGSTTYSMADLMVSFQPQSATGADGRKAWDTMVDNVAGFLWQRQGLRADTTDVVAAQKVNIIPVQLGVKVPVKTANDASGVFAFTQAVSVTSKPAWNVTVAA